MCVVSMIGDHYQETLPAKYPWVITTDVNPGISTPPVSRDEFNSLKEDVQEMKQLLIKAKIYDAENGEPDCEVEEKIALLRRIAELVGVDLEEVL